MSSRTVLHDAALEFARGRRWPSGGSSRRIQAVVYSNPDSIPPVVNGARLLAEHGWTVDVLSRSNTAPGGVSYPSSVNVIRLDPGRRSSVFALLWFVWHALRHLPGDADVVLGHDMYGFVIARLTSFLTRKPLVYHCHDFTGSEERLAFGRSVMRALERRFGRTADLVIVPDADRSVIVQRELRLKYPPLIVANGPLLRPAEDGSVLRQALGDRGSHYVRIVFRPGVIGPNHALETTIRSIPRWGSPAWGLVLMGPCDPMYREHLQRLARDLGVEDRLTILPPVGYDEIQGFTAGADLVHALYDPTNVNYQYATTASNKLMEAMAAGVPVVAMDTPGARRLISEHGCGVVAEPSSLESIASAINEALSDPVRAQEMGRAGRQAFEDVFCYDRQYARVLDALAGLVERKTAGS